MWLTSFMSKNTKETSGATAGSVTDCKGTQVEVAAAQRHREVPVASPFGVVSVPPAGARAVMVHTSAGDACVGFVQSEDAGLEPGEIILRSAGGATLVLKNDGKVYVNGKELGGA